MTVKRKRHLVLVIAALLTGTVTLSLRTLRAVDSEAERELTIVARQMAFYVNGNPQPNPSIVFLPGEQIAIDFINRDRGVAHNFVIPAWNLRTDLLKGDGSSERLLFQVPLEPAKTDYTCSIHPTMMTGQVRIR